MPATIEKSKSRPKSSPQNLVWHGVSWETYERLLKELVDQHVHMTYDNGELEIMPPISQQHDGGKTLIARMLESMAFELDIEMICLGSTTWARKDIKKGLEADECYYIVNAKRIAGKKIDLLKDPPPDLALEVDISRSSLDRQGIYAALGIRELWRFDDPHLQFLELQPGHAYSPVVRSVNFPFLNVHEFEQHIKSYIRKPENGVLRQFVQYAKRACAKYEK